MKGQFKIKSFLIIGQGIAGSLLGWCLIKAGHKVVIVDQNHFGSSSIVSAGIINPVTGQRLVLNPQFAVFHAYAQSIYSQIIEELGANFFISKPIIRVLRNKKEFERSHQLELILVAKPYIDAINSSGFYGKGIKDPFGTLTIRQGGYFQTQLMLNALKDFFIEKKALIAEHFSYDDLKISIQRAEWKEESFSAVIFCEGFQVRENPWFKDLPYNFVKGELLKVSVTGSSLPDAIICQQQWCVPLGGGTYLAGATYDRQNINTAPTDIGESLILKGLNDFIPGQVCVLERYAGVRPAMLNPVPVAAMHYSIPALGIFNGLGSKGFLLAPYYAQVFSEQLGRA